ncbi:MAG: LysR family transcriptional regulator [Rickettsiales bacterium]
MIDWDKLRIFHAVAGAGSFTNASEQLNLSQSAISRQISSLEERLKVSLFTRHARGLTLTEQGEILFSAANEILNRLSVTENSLLESKERPRGPLKITAPVAFGTTWLTPRMNEFSQAYQDIDISMLIDDKELDLNKREADVAIRLFPAKHPDLIQLKLTVLRNSIYASHEYLKKHGVPQKAKELSDRKLVIFGDDRKHPFYGGNWILKTLGANNPPKTPPFKINTMLGIVKAVESGMGITSLPDYIGRSNPLLTKILPEVNGPQTDVYFIYSTEIRNLKRVKVFKEFMLRKLSEDGLGRAS